MIARPRRTVGALSAVVTIAELLADFDLSLETGMRMRERYTLACDQVDLRGRQVVLDRTKNGDSREVPLSSVALRVRQVVSRPVGFAVAKHCASLDDGKHVGRYDG